MELNIDDLGDVFKKMYNDRAKWYAIGLELHVSSGTLAAIESEHRDPATCLRKTLEDWLKQVDPKPTWEALEDARKSCTVQEYHLEEYLEERYGARHCYNRTWMEHHPNGRMPVVALALERIGGK